VPPHTEEVDPEALLSRHIFDPPMFPGGALVATFLFEFPNNQCESVVWQNKLPNGLEGVHRLGCERQNESRRRQIAAGKDPTKTYIGAATSCCSLVRAYRNPNGHGVTVVHEPSEGLHHVHICYDSDKGAPAMTRGDKGEIKLKLLELFSDISRHVCPE
jgi:hypothetical protein